MICCFLNFFLIGANAWEIDATGTATYIVDGDTLDVSPVGRIRLADVDCPEQGETGCAEATQYLTSLVYNKEVYVDVDDVYGTDIYGRVVAVIYVYYDETHLKNVNKALLVDGHAEVDNYPNEFNPNDWTLLVAHSSSSPPDPPPPDPPPPDPPDDPPPDDDPNGNGNTGLRWEPIHTGIAVGCTLIGSSVIIVYFYFIRPNNLNKKMKKKSKRVPSKVIKDKVRLKRIKTVYIQDPLVDSIISDLLNRYSAEIVAIYGIGSYFDNSLPPEWEKNDLDIVVMVKTLEKIPKQDWTEVRYEKKELEGHQAWLGFNTINAYQNQDNFHKESFSNYEWSLIELKNPENSTLLYGADIRDQLPETTHLKFDYDDILARGLYHLDKSFSEKESPVARKEFSKGIFKTAFLLCTFFDSTYNKTSIIEVGSSLKNLIINDEGLGKMNEFFEEALVFRIVGQFKSDFINIRRNFILFLFSLLNEGKLHKKMDFQEILKYLSISFGGFSYLIQEIKKIENFALNIPK
jgi:micrococcal nuclease